jgi:hypothetical protein
VADTVGDPGSEIEGDHPPQQTVVDSHTPASR